MLSGQISSQKGWFTANFDAGCSPFAITITNSGTRPGSLFIDFFGDPADQFSGSGFTDSFTAGETRENLANPYNTAGTFLIRVVDQSGSGSTQDRFDFLEVTVVDGSTPVFTSAICNNNVVVLNFDFAQDDYDFYDIDFGDGQPPTILDKTGSNQVSYAYSVQGSYPIVVSGRLNTGSNVSCAVAAPVTINTIQTIPDPELNLLQVVSANTLDLEYTALTPTVQYSLQISENGGSFTEVAQLDPATNPQGIQYMSPDPNIDYNFTQIAVRLVATEACSGADVPSNHVQNIRAGFMASYTGAPISLERAWITQDPEGLLNDLQLFYGGVASILTPATQGSDAIDIDNCQQVLPFYFQGSFGPAISRSITINPDLAASSLLPPAPGSLDGRIVSSALEISYDPAPVPVTEYRIYRQTETGRELELSTTSLSTRITNFSLSASEVCYEVTYVDECGHESAASDPVCFQFTSSIVVPNAFAPGSTPPNNTFNIPYGIFLNFRMEIYNRWGRLLFVSNDAATGWDGTVNGQPAPAGGYVYRINYNSGQNTPVLLTGSFTLIR